MNLASAGNPEKMLRMFTSPKVMAVAFLILVGFGAIIAVVFITLVINITEKTSSLAASDESLIWTASIIYGGTTNDWNHRQSDNHAKQQHSHQLVGKYLRFRTRLDYNFHALYTPERQQFQDRLVDSILNESNAQNCTTSPWIVFTAGAMGAGKSYTMNLLNQKGRFPLNSFVTVDPDKIRQRLPEWAQLVAMDAENAGRRTHKEAGMIAELVVEAALERGYNVLVDGTLQDSKWYQSFFHKLRQSHRNIRIAILHVTAPLESVIRNAMERAKTTGRIVPRDVLLSSLEQVPKSMQVLRNLVDFAITLNNTGKDDVDIVTPGHNWETFRSQWAMTC